MLFQELFYGPYFCQVQDAQYYSYTELIPDGPTTKRMQDLAKQTGMVLVVPMYEEDEQASGHLLQHRRRHRRRRHVPRQVPQDPHPARQGLLGEVLLPARATSATRSSRRPSARSASTSATTATSPRAPGRSASTAPRSCFIPSATSRGLSEYLWRIEQVSHARRQRLLRRDDQPGRHRGRLSATTTSTARATSSTRAASSSATSAVRPRRGAARPRPRPRPDHRGPPDLAVLPRPATRRVRGPRRDRRSRYHPSGSAVWRRTAEPLRSRRRRATCSSGSRSSPSTRIERTLALTRQAEAAGFDYGWLFDSHVLWRDPYPLLTLMAEATERLRLGTCVTNPATREPTRDRVARSPTLDEISGGRMDLGHRARRLRAARPRQAADDDGDTRGGDPRHPGARRGRARSSTRAPSCSFPWTRGWTLPVWVAGYGPMALAMTGRVADGVILQLGRSGPHPLVRRPGPRGRARPPAATRLGPGPGGGAGPRRRPRDSAASGRAGSRPSSATTSSTSSTSTRASSCRER